MRLQANHDQMLSHSFSYLSGNYSYSRSNFLKNCIRIVKKLSNLYCISYL
jgi:hypothetical protein